MVSLGLFREGKRGYVDKEWMIIEYKGVEDTCIMTIKWMLIVKEILTFIRKINIDFYQVY